MSAADTGPPFPGSVEELDRLRAEERGLKTVHGRLGTMAAERYIRRRFILEQIARAPESERPTTEAEREDLERRLFALEGEEHGVPGLLEGFTSGDWQKWGAGIAEQLVERRERFDRRIAVSPTGCLAQELARIRTRIEPRVTEAEGLLPAEWSYSALLYVQGTLLDPPGSDEGNLYRAALAFHWLDAWDTWRTVNAAKLAARAALSADRLEAELAALEPNPETILTRAAEDMIPKAWAALRKPEERLPEPGTPLSIARMPSAIPETTGDLYTFDARLADFLETLGPPGKEQDAKELADAYRAQCRAELAQRPLFSEGPPENSPEAHDDFHPTRTRWTDCLWLPRIVARAAWKLRVKPELLDVLERRKRHTPAISQAVARDLEMTFWAPGRQIELLDTPGKARLVDADGNELAEVVPGLAPEAIEAIARGTKLFGSLTGGRVLWHLVRAAHWQHGQPNDADVKIEGGLQVFAKLIGENSKRAPDRIAEILRAGQSLRCKWPGGEIGGLWTYGWRAKAAPGQPAILVVTPAAFLRPFYAIKRLDADRRFSVPILPDPPFVGRERDWAAQGVFQFLFTAELLEHRVDLVREGGAKLSVAELADLARRAGLPAKILPAVLERWTAPGGPFKRDGDRYMLTDADAGKYGAAREWLLEAGRRTLGSRARRQRKRRPRTGT